MNSCVYLDNACTSHPKPDEVWKSIKYYIESIGASPSRSGHSLGKLADEIVLETRNLLAELFSVEDSNNIFFAQNATHALNTLIKGYLKTGDHVITTNLEHNSVLRPLEKLRRENKLTYSIVESNSLGIINPADIEKFITKNTSLIIANHASNAIGILSPIEKIGEIAKKHNIKFLVDASQTAGVVKIDVNKYNIDFLAFTGHKSLYGPSGIGGGYIKNPDSVFTLLEGGAGNNSKSLVHPGYSPDKFEAGTLNYLGIAGLRASLKYLKTKKNIVDNLPKLTQLLINKLSQLNGVIIYGSKNIKYKVPVVTFNHNLYFSNQLSAILDEKYNIQTRPGLHCAPLIHKTLKTDNKGAVRVSLGIQNTVEDINYLISSLEEITMAWAL